MPKLAEGDYQLQTLGNGFQAQSPVRVEDGTLVFLETDKPIYKPGQTIHIRAADPRPRAEAGRRPRSPWRCWTPRASRSSRRTLTTDEYGMATLDLPLSTEPNLGVWKVTAKAGKRTAQVDVRVERYVLPKYEVKVDLPKDWVLASDRDQGHGRAPSTATASRSQGEVQIKATRYVGKWQEFANVTKSLDGKVDFQLPAVRYVTGVPGAGGMGNVSWR